MANVLVVDDRPVNREFLTSLLGYHGHVTFEAGCGAEGLRLARERHPDLVFTDISMPGMDGYEFVRQIRSDPRVSGTPVVFYSAVFDEQEARRLAAACGVNHLLTMPCDPQVLLETACQVLRAGQSKRLSPPETGFDRDRANLLATKLETKIDELEAANLRLSGLLEISQKLSAEFEPTNMVLDFCSAARRIMSADRATIGLLSPPEWKPRRVFVSEVRSERTEVKEPSALELAFVEKLWQGQFRVFGGPPQLDAPATFGRVPETGGNFIGMPIRTGGKTLGFLYFLRQGGPAFTQEEGRLASTLAAQVGVAHERAHSCELIRCHASELEREVAERRAAEQSLRLSEERFQKAFEASPDAMFISLLDSGRLLEVNCGFTRITGYSQEEAAGRTSTDLNLWISAEARDKVRNMLEHGERVRDFEIEFRAKSGERRTGSLSAELVELASANCILAILRDITERRALEARLRQSDKMEALGQLAGGVAHDFNNLLVAINGFAETTRDGLPPAHPLRDCLEQILSAAGRASGLTKQLLSFSRAEAVEPEVFDLNELVRDMGKLLRRLMQGNIDIAVEFGSRSALVHADRTQIGQVLLNLTLNARDAMPHGGTIRISSKVIELEGNPARVALAVSDEGVGMDAATKQRLFERFFTTKPAGKGTGLGLKTVQEIVNRCDGQIEVWSEPGRGAIFTVILPMAAQKQPSPRPQAGTVPEFGRNVLVVDDDQMVRQSLRLMLSRSGYKVIEAGDVDAALKILDATPVDLLLTDLRMPGRDGYDLVATARAAHPGLRILMTSAFPEAPNPEFAELPMLRKPFSSETLRLVLRDVLSQTENAGVGS